MTDQQHTFALEFLNLLPLNDFQTIFDVGAGPGYQTQWLRERGKDAYAVDVSTPRVDVPYLVEDMTVFLPRMDESGTRVDAIWSHHALEHVENPHIALRNMNDALKPNGWLFLTVPQIDTTISNGHIVSYNMPLVVYQLALAGFDTRNGYFGKFRSHLRAAVRKGPWAPQHAWEVSIQTLFNEGRLPVSTQQKIVESGRFDGASLTTTWLDGSTHTY